MVLHDDKISSVSSNEDKFNLPFCALDNLMHLPSEILKKYDSIQKIFLDPCLSKVNWNSCPNVGYDGE